jgi:DinB family protein
MTIWSAAVSVILIVTAVSAQPSQPLQKVDLTTYLQSGYAGIKGDLTSAAEAMPEADYGFKPSSMPEVRTFGETIAHVAAAHFSLCARVRGVAAETAHTAELKPTTKADVLKTLAASFAFCDPAFSSLTEGSTSEFVRQGPVEVPKNAALVGLLAHDAEMYGITTVYLRAKNIVPPSTARQKKGDR